MDPSLRVDHGIWSMVERYNLHMQVSNTNNTRTEMESFTILYMCSETAKPKYAQTLAKRNGWHFPPILSNQPILLLKQFSNVHSFHHHCLSRALPCTKFNFFITSQQLVSAPPADTRRVVVLRAGAKPWPTSKQWDINPHLICELW